MEEKQRIKTLFKETLEVAKPSTNPDDYVELERILDNLAKHLKI